MIFHGYVSLPEGIQYKSERRPDSFWTIKTSETRHRMAMLAMFVSIRQSAAVKKTEYFEMFITYIQHVVLNTISHTMNPLMFLSFSVPGFPRSIGPSGWDLSPSKETWPLWVCWCYSELGKSGFEPRPRVFPRVFPTWDQAGKKNGSI